MPCGRRNAAVFWNDWENRASRNSPSLAVALNCGMGSSSLNAEMNAFERPQIVCDGNQNIDEVAEVASHRVQ
jgi:hypothetical protein